MENIKEVQESGHEDKEDSFGMTYRITINIPNTREHIEKIGIEKLVESAKESIEHSIRQIGTEMEREKQDKYNTNQ